MERKRKTLGDESLSWIDKTGESEELGVLKEYVSEESEPDKGRRPGASSLFHDDASTIGKKKKRGKQGEEIIEEIKEEAKKMGETISEKTENIKTEEKKVREKISYEKIKVKTADALGTAAKMGNQAVDAISKAFGSEKLNIKQMADSVASACSQPLETLSSIDRNINNSVKNLMQIDDKSLIDNNLVKPIKNIEASINLEIKKLLGLIL